MGSVEQFVKIELFGQPFTFRALSEGKKAQEVADLFVREVARVQSQQSKQSPGITHTAILIIAALNIANENMELKKTRTDLARDLSERSKNLIRELDALLN